ncbi:MAG TPA: DUF202 domain-containing protein [Rhodanobacteraceae bacterium]|nr:DUF202 domain-containing protein [Rhodanobacteraceae bacterium]
MAANEDLRTLHTFRQMATLQARVCYMNVDRTLATWTRTALALIVFGTVVDRYGILLLRPHLAHVGTRLAPNPMSSLGGILLVAIGVFIVATAAIRHHRYALSWNRTYGRDRSFGPWLALPFAVGVALLGTSVLAILLVLVLR